MTHDISRNTQHATPERSRPGFNWLKRVALPVGLAVMELCWLYPWSLLVGRWVQPDADMPLVSALGVLVLLLASHAATRAVRRARWPLPALRGLLLGLGLVVILLVVYADHYRDVAPYDLGWLAALGGAFAQAPLRLALPVVAVFLGLAVWWRGITHGRGALGLDDVVADSFRFGLIGLVTCLVAAALTSALTDDRLVAHVGVYALGYVFAGLITLSLARLEAVREQSQARHGAGLAINRHWLGVLLGVVTVMLMVTVGLAQVFSIDLLSGVLRPLLRLLGAVAWLVLMPLALGIGLLVEAVIMLLRRLMGPPAPREQPPLSESPLDRLREGWEAVAIPPEILLVLSWIGLGLMAVVVLLLLAKAITWSGRPERDDDVVEERDSVWTWRMLRAAAWAWLAALLRRFRPRPATTVARASPQTDATAISSPGLLTIRQYYRQLLRLGAAVGVRRTGSTTPHEHLPPLQARLGPADDLAWLTDTYVRARYGPASPSEAEVAEARRRWSQVAATTAEAAEDATRTDQPDARETRASHQ